MNFESLREANIKRQGEWPGNVHADLAFRTLEVCGETGEFAEAVMNWLHLKQQSALAMLNDEMADVIISIDLLAHELGIDLPMAVSNTLVFDIPSNESLDLGESSNQNTALAIKGLEVCKFSGLLAESVKKLLRDQRGIAGECGSTDQVVKQMANLIKSIDALAKMLDLNLAHIVANKFNKTSSKYGFATRLTISG